MEYPFEVIEKKWQKKWQEKRVFKADDNSPKPKYYVLSMFPYPSGALHMGHVSNYSIGDAISRYKMMQGFNVMQPMGYDAFGMPAENFAIQHNSHPRLTTESNMNIMQDQFTAMGFGFDWDRKVATCTPDYYRWGQWIFKRLYEKGLVYKKSSFVNWCDECQTVLANEQVEDGSCWRCSSVVRQKEMEQWYFKITEYAEELLDFSKVIDWPERVMSMQKNWIGRSTGTEIDFKLEGSDEKITVFTTRPDTIFGVTFMAIPPEHPLSRRWLKEPTVEPKLVEFCEKVLNEDKISRSAEDTTKEGVFTGKYCINPVNGDKVQIWITNYVLMDYGTGAVMAVPAHDQRDFEFAKKYDIPMKMVIQNIEKTLVLEEMTAAYTEPGVLVNSAQFDDMESVASKTAISQWINEKGMGKETITYRLRDWGVSRQRYWGNPIPVIYCDKCGTVLVPDKDLPVLLPDNVQVGKTTNNPLLSVEEWVNCTCPECGGPARRETDTMDTFVDSSWYFARYADPKNENLPFSKEKAEQWLPVDQYIGGIEHACMHLIYARFFHKFLRDIGMVDCDEPFARLLTQGMVINMGSKMSKSKGNGVDPQEYIDRYGSDTIRVFMLFASPPEKDVDWNDEAVGGSFRFLNRVWRLIENNLDVIKTNNKLYNGDVTLSKQIAELRFSTHNMIKRWHEDIENKMQFNTAIAAIMEHLNCVTAIKDTSILTTDEKAVYAESCMMIVRLLYPFAPHICEELYEMTGNTGFVYEAGIPEFNPQYLVHDMMTVVVQINGKIRGKIDVPAGSDEETIKAEALNIDKIKTLLEGLEIKKVIVVQNKLVSIVAK
ncbi:MAG: leucine--tRNA ligase [Candidatus Cloacimonetes bacterium]|nr:leucine--tRNA ligase [Candidatus Cloacimonadota bacterium]